MNKFAEWLTARPIRSLFAGTVLAVLALIALPVLAWLPAGLVVLGLLATGSGAATLAAAGAALPIAWGFSPVIGLGGGLVVAAAVLVPAYLAGSLLVHSRSLSVAFQAVTLAACALVLLVRLVLGDPTGVLMPLLDVFRPALEETARALAGLGVERTPEEIGEATARVAWATGAWMLLLHTMTSLFAGLWAFAAMREPGLFGRQFRGLRLGSLVAWAAMGALLVSFATQWASGRAWAPAEDVLFVLAGAFLLQALAVVHGLRATQAIGPVLVAMAYVGVLLVPMALVGLGFADTWVRFRDRFGARPGASQG
ncbi:MAG: hypothetical protein H6R27_981 [Proteobacteria bacterium]|nr:hypothetical protein [Pseudomonadota bacterium]